MEQTNELASVAKSIKDAYNRAGKKYDDMLERDVDKHVEEEAKKWLVKERKDVIDKVRQILEIAGTNDKPSNENDLGLTTLSLNSRKPYISLFTNRIPPAIREYAPAFRKSLEDLVTMLDFESTYLSEGTEQFHIMLYFEPRNTQPKIRQLDIDDPYTRLAQKRAAGNDDADGPEDIMEIMGSNKRARVKKEEEDEGKHVIDAGNHHAAEKGGKNGHEGSKGLEVKKEEDDTKADDSGFAAAQLDGLVKKEEE